MTQRILLTNDDGPHTPFFAFLLERLSSQFEVLAVAPKHQQSWKAKSVTAAAPLRLERIQIGTKPVYTLDGTPADCVNFAIYNLFKEPPDLVVSGINVGSNTGLSFLWSSGTVGACLEANLAKLPGLALSQELDSENFETLGRGEPLPTEVLERLRAQTDMVLEEVLAVICRKPGPFNVPLTWSVNLPFVVRPDWEVKPVDVAMDLYKSLFHARGDEYWHDLRREDSVRDGSLEGDFEVLKSGHVTLSEVDPWVLGRLSDTRRQDLMEVFRRKG
ncbi:MAG: 5'/3'-nucleotidase SurE [Deltaproteobacteria bacterium]|nr:5'/3'-nucleotidase SurE [Deltaproteobacteria bacterium]